MAVKRKKEAVQTPTSIIDKLKKTCEMAERRGHSVVIPLDHDEGLKILQLLAAKEKVTAEIWEDDGSCRPVARLHGVLVLNENLTQLMVSENNPSGWGDDETRTTLCTLTVKAILEAGNTFEYRQTPLSDCALFINFHKAGCPLSLR